MSKLALVSGVIVLFLLLILGMILPCLISTNQLPASIILLLVVLVVFGSPVLLFKLGNFIWKSKRKKNSLN